MKRKILSMMLVLCMICASVAAMPIALADEEATSYDPVLYWDISNVPDDTAGNAAVAISGTRNVVSTGWYTSAATTDEGLDVYHTFKNGKYVYDPSANEGKAANSNLFYHQHFGRDKGSLTDDVPGFGTGIYTLRVPFKILNALGGSLTFNLHNGDTRTSIGQVNYAGALYNFQTKMFITPKDTIKVGNEHIVEFVIDNTAEEATVITTYLDGVKCQYSTNVNEITLSKIGYIQNFCMNFKSHANGLWNSTGYEIGNIALYEGNLYEEATITASANQILLPEAGKTVKLQINASAAVELAKAYTGVSLSADGSLIVDGSAANDSSIAADGKITIVAKHPAALKGTELDIPVSTIYHDIDNTPDSKYPEKFGTADTWHLVNKATNIAEDTDGNKFMQSAYKVAEDGTMEDSHNKYTYKSYVLPTGLSGRVVLDMDYRVPFGFHPNLDADGNPTNKGGAAQIRFYTTKKVDLLNINHCESSSIPGYYFYTFKDVYAKTEGRAIPEYVEGEPHRTTGAWQKLTFVFDYDLDTYSILLNGNVITANQSFDVSTISSLRIGGQWDNLRVYNAPHTAPVAYNLAVTDAGEDKVAHGSYSYYSIPGYADECSILKWYIADSADSESWTFVGDGEDYPVKPEDVGRYLKFAVQPASGESLTGVEFLSSPVRVTDAQIDVYSPVLRVNGDAQGKLTAGKVNTLTYSVSITNYTDSDKEIMLLAGMYDADELLAPDCDIATLKSGETRTFSIEVSAECTVENLNSAKARVFLWTGNLSPVEIPFDLPVVTK